MKLVAAIMRYLKTFLLPPQLSNPLPRLHQLPEIVLKNLQSLLQQSNSPAEIQ